MNTSRFNVTGSRIVDGKRAFAKCLTLKCKTRWVSNTKVLVQDGYRVDSYLGRNGWEQFEDRDHPYTRTLRVVSYERPACPKCGARNPRWEKLTAHYVPEVPCDARCTTAKGPNCSCSCGGAHHGEDA